MLTPTIQASIFILHKISDGKPLAHLAPRPPQCTFSMEKVPSLLTQLAIGGLIKLIDVANPEQPHSYRLVRSIQEISLLDIMEATNEYLNCNQEITEEFYLNRGRVARQLGIINSFTRNRLAAIKLADL